MKCPTCHAEMIETDATRDHVVGHELVGDMIGETINIEGVDWCQHCGTLVHSDLEGQIVEVLVPKGGRAAADERVRHGQITALRAAAWDVRVNHDLYPDDWEKTTPGLMASWLENRARLFEESIVEMKKANDESPTVDIPKIIEKLETMIWGVVQRPLLYAANLHMAEQSISHYTFFRSMLLGKHSGSWLKWYAANYPELGSSRSVAKAVQERWPEKEHHSRFRKEMTRLLVEVEELQPPGEEKAQT